VLEFEVHRATRRCAVTSREFQPGEVYYSLLVEDSGQVMRRDYAASAWPGPPERAVGWWRATLPETHSAGPKMAPNDIALELFDHWRQQSGREDATYVLALLLVRKRVFRFNDTAGPSAEDSADLLHLLCPARATEYTLPIVEISPERAAEIQAELVHLLYADSP
jgi:hypothetical protein